jgi:hypothetical protein
MADDKSLFLSDRTKLKWMPKSYKHYLNKTTIVYGRTGSGKSVIIEEIMKMCQAFVPSIFVVAPTNSSNNAYTNKVPVQFIKKELDVDFLEKLLERQKNSANAYNNANNLEILKSLFNRISDDISQSLEASIVQKARDAVLYIDTADLAFASKKNQKVQINEERDNMLRKLYKTTIRFNKVELEQRKDLDKLEYGAIEFLDFNPNVILILDDCASKFKKMYKKSSAIKEIFYEGRHYFFTTIISSQDDKEIDSELRKNTSVSIFTTAQSATSNFERASNGYPKHERVRAKICTEGVFKQDENDSKHFQKLVYLQGAGDPFKYTIADIYDDFRMGSNPMWCLSDKILERRTKRVSDNPMFTNHGKNRPP